jgi:hypothetical protein
VAALALCTLLVVFLFTGSIAAVLGTALVLVIAAPVLVLLIVDRSRP